MFTAIVLSEQSHNLLIELLGELIPRDFEIVAHHLTLTMGTLKDKSLIGKTVHLVANKIAKDDKVIAISVCKGGELSTNAIPHITVAVNRKAGGRPYDSNNLREWNPLSDYIDLPFINLIGTIQECD